MSRRFQIVFSVLGVTLACSTTPPESVQEPISGQHDRPGPGKTDLEVIVQVVDESGAPLAGVPVAVHGSDDWMPRAMGSTDARGRVVLPLESTGYFEFRVGKELPAPRNCGFGRSKASTLALEVGEGLTIDARAEGSHYIFKSGLPGTWRTREAHARYLDLLEALMVIARSETPDAAGLASLVDQQWAEIEAEPDANLRKALAIEWATCVTQLTGPQHLLRVVEAIPPEDGAWVAQAAFLPQVIWSLGDHEAAVGLRTGLAEHHDDPGLRASLLRMELQRAHEAEDSAGVGRLFEELSARRYAKTNAVRDARKFDPGRPLRIGARLPDFSVQRLGDRAQAFASADLGGRTWVVQVWSSWCRPCMEELERLPELYAELRDEGLDVEFVSISTDDARADCERALSDRELPWVLAWAADQDALMKAWGFSGVPLTVVVDAKGEVVAFWDGAARNAAIGKAVRTAAVLAR